MTDKDTHNIHIQTYIHITHIYKDYTYIDTHNTCTYICTQHIYTPHTYIYTQCMYTCYICIYIVNTHRHHPPVQIHIRGTQTYIHHTNTHTDIHTHSHAPTVTHSNEAPCCPRPQQPPSGSHGRQPNPESWDAWPWS